MGRALMAWVTRLMPALISEAFTRKCIRSHPYFLWLLNIYRTVVVVGAVDIVDNSEKPCHDWDLGSSPRWMILG